MFSPAPGARLHLPIEEDYSSGVHTRSRSILILALAAIVAIHPVPLLSAPSEEITVSLITILPGPSLYAAFGHSAIRIVDRQNGTDRLYNYGISVHPFDARFALGMLTGHMEFMVAALDTQESFAFYRDVENRTIIEQVLNLDSAQIETLISTLKHDIRPENRIYNYRYFTDNCATRVWDLLAPFCTPLDAGDAAQHNTSLRDQLYQAMIDNPWLRTGIDLLLGPAADKPDRPMPRSSYRNNYWTRPPHPVSSGTPNRFHSYKARQSCTRPKKHPAGAEDTATGHLAAHSRHIACLPVPPRGQKDANLRLRPFRASHHCRHKHPPLLARSRLPRSRIQPEPLVGKPPSLGGAHRLPPFTTIESIESPLRHDSSTRLPQRRRRRGGPSAHPGRTQPPRAGDRRPVLLCLCEGKVLK